MDYFNRNGKHNFVDDNNVLVGYDSNQCCCEDATWIISDEKDINYDDYDDGLCNSNNEMTIDGFVFDVNFYEKSFWHDAGNRATFKLINEKTDEIKYLHLVNDHNGYYSHGFIVEVDGKIINEDWV